MSKRQELSPEQTQGLSRTSSILPQRDPSGVVRSASTALLLAEDQNHGILRGGLTPVDRLQGCVRRRRFHATLTLHQCLEQVVQFGTDYVLTDQGGAWTAAGLLAWLALRHPTHLELPMYLRLPNAQQDGAICELTPSGGFMLRYRIEHRIPL